MSTFQVRVDAQGNVNFMSGDTIEASVSAKVMTIALLATLRYIQPQLSLVTESTIQDPMLTAEGHLTWMEDGQAQSYDLSSAQCTAFFADLYQSAEDGGMSAASMLTVVANQIAAFQQFYTQLENDHYGRAAKMQEVTRQQLNLANANVLALLRHKLGNTRLNDLLCAINDLSAGIMSDAQLRQVTSVVATTEPATLEELAASPTTIFKKFFVKEKRNAN